MEESDVLSIFENPQNTYTKALLSALPENAQGDRLLTIHDFTEELNEAGISITEE